MKTIDIFKINIEIDKLYHKLEEEDKKIFFNIMDAFDNCVVENDKKDKEIERLKKTIDAMIDNEEEYCLEINRLNNIINELGKYLNEQIQKSWEIEEQCYEDIESKLQELKEKE